MSLSTVGLKVLNIDAWQTEYALTIGLYEGAAEVAYLGGNFEQMQQWAGSQALFCLMYK